MLDLFEYIIMACMVLAAISLTVLVVAFVYEIIGDIREENCIKEYPVILNVNGKQGTIVVNECLIKEELEKEVDKVSENRHISEEVLINAFSGCLYHTNTTKWSYCNQYTFHALPSKEWINICCVED